MGKKLRGQAQKHRNSRTAEYFRSKNAAEEQGELAALTAGASATGVSRLRWRSVGQSAATAADEKGQRVLSQERRERRRKGGRKVNKLAVMMAAVVT